MLVTYEIVCSAGDAADIGPLLKSFLGHTATDGQATLDTLGAAPLPRLHSDQGDRLGRIHQLSLT